MTPARRRRRAAAPPRDPLPAYFGVATAALEAPPRRERAPTTRATPLQTIPELQLVTDEELDQLTALMEILNRRGALAEAHGMPIDRRRHQPTGG